MSSAAATTAAITGDGAATTATTAVLNATGGDPTYEIKAAAQAAQSVGATAGQIAQGANQFWTSTTLYRDTTWTECSKIIRLWLFETTIKFVMR